MLKSAVQQPLSIEQITPQLTWRLRRQVLYPQSKLLDMEMEEDLQGVHFGAFTDNQLIGVVSLFANEDSYQFRKLAIDASYQHKGYGTILLDYITAYSATNNGTILWCNARLSAIPFYLKHGFHQTAEIFTKNGIEYEILKKFLA
jgi:GNAT superfamily N-acetyltransferase